MSRPMRADARRNYERLLAEARELFGEEGPDVPLEDIARRAEVGIGTLYRHFPTRQALQEAVYRDQIEALAADAYELAERDEPGESLVRWIRSMMSHSTAKRGLNSALVVTLGRDSELFSICRDVISRAGGTLLAKAQEAGAVRRDVEILDLLKLIHAIALATEKSPETADRLIMFVIEGLRPR
ncbi:TetR/AcrR family transcriptional regulator [Planotetraspora sp. A-T 1434]|uniref:TetR/AcrR family transcriptional regulator n=1 Tax=Planotetraspora sp. A-T 1434 TaxID=2979219 RepID=UPI0021C22C31|nr:TetR/AcrR family transcriptional regulator [Planotetraspora sp. A-T 1434]MCT9931057.1 TetR/AcrR family transcriptional regulator [Planotetraspora sp. A-T 1434]